jgi:PAS domain S-box-containing protein
MALRSVPGSLETHLIAVMLLLAILPAAAVGWTAYNMMFEYIRSDHLDTVGRVADSKRTQLIMVLEHQNERARSFLSNLVAQCGGNAARPDSVCASNLVKSYLAAEKALGATLRRHGAGQGVTAGTPAIRNAENITLRAGQLAQFSGTGPGNNLSYFISADEPRGYRLVITYPSSTLDSVFDPPPAELGQSGETFLADGEGYFVTKPKYPSVQGHSHPISARPMRDCLKGENRQVVDGDYRDVTTIMGFRFIPEFGSACIMAHHGEEEAFAPANSLERRLIIAMLVFCLILIAATVYIAKSIVRPVTKLTKVARAIASGDYTAKADTGGNDEIAELAASFNYMTSELYEQSALLEDQVRDRTKELEQTQQKTEALLRRNQALMKNSLDGITITDERGSIVEVNDAFCRKLGYTREEISGLKSSDWETQPAEELRMRYKDLIGKSAIFETSYRRKDGTLINVEVSSAGMEIDGRRYIFSSTRDITARKQVDARLLQTVSSLQATNKALDEFTYIAAHDLKEPLRGIHNYTSFLREDYGDRLNGEARQYINSIQRLAERLSALIDRLLAYSRLGSTELAKEPVDVDAVVDAVVEDLSSFWMAPSQGGMGIELRRKGPLGTVQGDATRIGEVFQNLISNAAKYNDKPLRWIEIGCDRSGATPVFYVRDNGIGIMPHHQDSVFRIFKRLHEQNKYGGGTGAGLTIAKKIIELHGGRIWLESIPEEGTVFYFTLSEDA